LRNLHKIIQFELVTLLRRKSYRRVLFFVPLVGFLFYSGAYIINRTIAPEGEPDLFADSSSDSEQGLVDQSRLITFIPEEVAGKIILIQDEEQAREMAELGKLSSFFIIDENYLENGRVEFIQRDYNFFSTSNETANLNIVITQNIFSDRKKSIRYLEPMSIAFIELVSEKTTNQQSDAFWLPYSMTILFYMLILGASSLMLNSITNEKKNRVIEILLTSTSTKDLLIGKMIALGIAGLIQTILWLGSGTLLLTLAGRASMVDQVYVPSFSIFIWGLIYFILGYALYSSFMSGLGALVPNPKEGSQATFFVIFPLFIPLFFSATIASAPNSPLFVVLSLFPLTSPVMMIARMTAATVPVWQIALSIGLLGITIVYVTQAILRLFRAQTLLSGKPFKAKDYFSAMINRFNE
jgi:ABC-2 type transport system permease protein